MISLRAETPGEANSRFGHQKEQIHQHFVVDIMTSPKLKPLTDPPPPLGGRPNAFPAEATIQTVTCI
jgi:hypothetical protein